METKTIVSIHQPNLFPWLGFFHKIIKSDVFIYLDHTENNPRSAIYTKRVQLLVNNQPYWLTIPLKNNEALFMPINKMEIALNNLQKGKLLKTIDMNYNKTPFFSETYQLVLDFFNHPSQLISDRNISFVENICKLWNIKTKRVKSSSLNLTGSSNDLLSEICKKMNGTQYLYGGGASDYQNNETFTKNNIQPIAQNFKHPEYRQIASKNFIPGLSIIDAFCNIGINRTKELLLGF